MENGAPSPKYRYVAVYADGLQNPKEIALYASDLLDEKNPDDRSMVEKFIHSAIDMDCRHLLFFYREYTASELTDRDPVY